MNLNKWTVIPKEQAQLLGTAALLIGGNGVWKAISFH